jgi:peptidyl-prolyl cis-trans isomerase SurA
MNQLLSFAATAATALAFAMTPPAHAQGLFDPVVSVNDSVVTEFEVEQRQLFLNLLNAPGSGREAVITSLIDERLRRQAVNEVGLVLDEEGLEAGMTEFASRANLTTEQFVGLLQQNGVARETFENFVSIGISWRDYVNGRFGPRVEISESEIDRALGRSGDASDIRVLVSEIIIPAPADIRNEVEEIALQISESQSVDEFSEYARQYSATATRDAGGRLPWQNLSELPPVLRPLLLALAPGEVTEPISIPDAVAIFQLRDIQETGVAKQEFAAIEYASYYMPGGRSEATLAAARKLALEVDACDDLYGIAQGQPEEVLDRVSQTPAEIPQDIAIELSKLDPGEISTVLTRNGGQTLVFLMLCGRTAAINQEVAREDVAAALRQARVAAYADSYMEQLRADARIIRQ